MRVRDSTTAGMRRAFLVISITALFQMVAVPVAAFASSFGNEDVVRLLRAGLAEATILQAIETTKAPKFDTSASGLIQLKQAGASDAILQRIIARQTDSSDSAKRESTPSPAGANCQIEAPGEGLFARADNTLVRLRYQLVSVEHKRNAGSLVGNVFSFGAVPVKVSAVVRLDGGRADVRLRDRAPVFLDFLFPIGRAAVDTMVPLLRLTPSDNGRVVEVARGEGTVWTGAKAEDVAQQTRIPVTLQLLSEDCAALGKRWSHYRMKPATELEPGEYAFMQNVDGKSVRLFDFGID